MIRINHLHIRTLKSALDNFFLLSPFVTQLRDRVDNKQSSYDAHPFVYLSFLILSFCWFNGMFRFKRFINVFVSHCLHVSVLKLNSSFGNALNVDLFVVIKRIFLFPWNRDQHKLVNLLSPKDCFPKVYSQPCSA